jgi:hypothetical protein
VWQPDQQLPASSRHSLIVNFWTINNSNAAAHKFPACIPFPDAYTEVMLQRSKGESAEPPATPSSTITENSHVDR